MKAWARVLPLAALMAMMATGGSAQEVGKQSEREYPFPLAAVKAALQNLGANAGTRLPSLEGFIKLEGVHLEEYQRPYYEYKLDLVPSTPNRTLVRVRANVTAWQGAPEGSDSGYRTLESNGRLETDLLDRLGEYLLDKPADPAALQKRIEEVREQRQEAEKQLAELEAELRRLQTAPAPVAATEYAIVKHPQTPVLSTPLSNASVLVHAQRDDEFAVLERRGEWLRVSLEGTSSGWIKRSSVDSSSPGQGSSRPAPVATAAAPTPAPSVNSFTIIREMPSDFSGDWSTLKGKRALYVWARPQGSTLNETGNKLQFAQSVFQERYRQVAHSSQSELAGIVIIFLDQRGGVAAASMEDIGLWDTGVLTPQAFLKKCSLDPPSAFLKPPRAAAAQNRSR